jgi:hypothetical protein
MKVAREIEISKNLRDAKRTFRELISADLGRILGECQENLESEATSADPDPATIKRLLNEIDRLQRDSVLPSAPHFDYQRRTHLEFRRAAAVALHDVYRQTVRDLTKALEVQRAIEVKDEMDNFASKEGLSSPTTASADAKPVATAPAQPASLPPFNLADALAKFADDVKQVASHETGAVRDKEHRTMMDRVNRSLGPHTVTLHYDVREIVTTDGRGFTAQLGAPAELANITGITHDLHSYKLDSTEARQASIYRRGDVVELSGTPFLATSHDFLAGRKNYHVATIRFGAYRDAFGSPTYGLYFLKPRPKFAENLSKRALRTHWHRQGPTRNRLRTSVRLRARKKNRKSDHLAET